MRENYYIKSTRKISKILLVAMLILSGCTNIGGSDEPYIIKFAHVVSARTPKGMAADEFKRVIEEKSAGRIVVDVYTDSQLGID